MSTNVDQLQENYYFANQQLTELHNLILQYIEIDDDFSFKHNDIRDTLENFFIGRSMLEHPSNLKDDPDAQTDREVQTEHWNSERLSE